MRRIAWIADSPRFIQVDRWNRPTGNVIEGKQARLLQYKLDTEEKRLPSDWVVDWTWESDRRLRWRDIFTTDNGVRNIPMGGGRRHRIDRSIRLVTFDDVMKSRVWFQHTFPHITWHPLQVPRYVWSSVDNWVTDVYDDDAPIILYGCYGEFADVTDVVIRDDLRSVSGAANPH
jgi:hypothetical protein